MDRIKKLRTTARTSFTKTLNEIKAEGAKPAPDKGVIEDKLKILEIAFIKLETQDNQLIEFMVDEDLDQALIDAEQETIVKYQTEWMTINRLHADKIKKDGSDGAESHHTVVHVHHDQDEKRNFRLPKIELKKFNGEYEEWLGWWSQFSKIHEDKKLHEADKFDYLIQSMVPGSRASNLVKSYPPTVENYPKVIEKLKDRYGDKSMLAEVYIRKLQSVILGLDKSKSKGDLCQTYDDIETQLRCLESLEITLDHSAFMLPLIESTLPIELIKVWQRSPEAGYLDDIKKSSEERLKSLMQFVQREVKGEERIKMIQGKSSESGSVASKMKKNKQSDVPTAQSLFSDSSKGCIFCGLGNHNSQDCFKANKMSLEERNQKVKESHGCFCCFKPGHSAKLCKAKIQCVICGGKHWGIMCRNKEKTANKEKQPEVKPPTEELKLLTVNPVVSNANQTNQDGLVLMKTVRVNVVDAQGRKRGVRLLFDEGSNRSYIKTTTAQTMGCELLEEFQLQTTLFGGKLTAQKSKKKFSVQLQSLDRKFTGNYNLINEDSICGSIPTVPNGPWLEKLTQNNIVLNDRAGSSSEIEILIGSNLWPQMMTGRIVKLSQNLIAVESVFGWTISGEIHSQAATSNCASAVISMLTQGERSLPELWELESIGIKETAEKLTQAEHDEKVMKEFKMNVVHGSDGRYIVQLPWIDKRIPLPANKGVCERRLMSTTNKLRNEKLYHTYAKIFSDWEEEGIIEGVSVNQSGHYLPHHRVLKLESKTTPVRPVFDASCKVGSNPSLNECLERGPNLLELIPSILMRFREKNIGIISDIRKAFQMIKIAEDDKNFQKFLWWEEGDQNKLKEFRHCRVVFGMNCSPFILAAVINYHLEKVDNSQNPIAELLRNSLYVDNCVISLDTEEDYKNFRDVSVSILADAKMDLRQWESNCEETDEEVTSVLGLQWNKKTDMINCKVPSKTMEKINKRTVLSIAAKIYDPIGFTCPALLQPKLMLQSSWVEKIEWDQEWNEDDQRKFKTWLDEIDKLQKIQIPRVAIGSYITELQLHLFTDASQDAYAAAIFARVKIEGRVKVQLLCAKSRLAPISKAKTKKITIPRLELMGCNIGARLLKSTMQSLTFSNYEVICWSDSTTALAWIKRDENWGTFVGNRVREINILTDKNSWRHVPGEMNPADLPSRGCSPQQLKESKWWEGPSWLLEDAEKWPSSQIRPDEEKVLEEKRKSPANTNVTVDGQILPFSSYWKNLRVAAYVRRFIGNYRVKKEHWVRSKHFSQDEMRIAEMDILRKIQKSHYPQNQTGSKIKAKLEQDGLLHVETRLTYKEDCNQFKSPILLPGNDPLVHQLIEFVHKLYCHAGAHFILNKLRERYWITQGRRTVRKVIGKCVTCKRFSVQALKCDPAPLPIERIETKCAFETTGVDLAGPLQLKGGKKAWIVIYTCAVYRGVYLDVIDSLSSEEFLNSLHKFTCTIGRPSTMFSDNGTNFVGSQTMMKKLDWQKIQEKFEVKQIKWKFNPPTAAWWGGWWERLIRTLKDLLRRMIGTAKLTRKELETCMAEISYVMNNRPLTVLTEDDADLVPLTPQMFMRDLPISGLPEMECMTQKDFGNAYHKLRDIKMALKARFRKEYLGNLIQRQSEKVTPDPREGDIVLVGSDNKKRFEWPLGRILEILPGKDAKVRTAKVKTRNGILLRPLQRLYPLEISSPSEVEVTKDISVVKSDGKETDVQESKGESEMCTRFGRHVKKPQRYGQWSK